MVSGIHVAKLAGKVFAVVMAFLVVVALVIGGLVAAGVIDVKPPSVESVSNEWGEVTENSTQLRTSVVVDNPNPVGLPGVLSIEYAASMNDVVLVEGKKGGVGLPTGQTTIALDGEMQNQRIVDWWVAHVNRGETSQLSITAEVNGPLGISQKVPVQRTSFETDLLGQLSESGPTEVSVQGETVLRVSDRSASWGEANQQETPVTFSATVENARDEPIAIDGFVYEVKMNDVVVGSGNATEGVQIGPGSTEDVQVQATIDTPKMADWWASHVSNGEETNLSVTVYPYVERDGQRQRLPMNVVDQDVAFTTNFLQGGQMQVRPLETGEPSTDVGPPEILSTDREWGEVTDDVTEIRSNVRVDNPNDGEFSDLLTVEVGGTTTINDVVVAEDRTVVEGMEPGQSTLTHVTEMDNSKVPEWWARHVNNGEESTFVTETEATADAGFTTFDVPVEDKRGTITTDVLGEIQSTEKQTFSASGTEVAVLHETSASWGTATPSVAPMTLEITIENTGPVELTIRDLEYDVSFNDVVIADATAPESYVLQPGETRTLQFSLELDNSKMDEWWVTHVRNGESTTATFETAITVDAAGQTSTVELDPTTTTVETDILNSTDTTRMRSVVAA